MRQLRPSGSGRGRRETGVPTAISNHTPILSVPNPSANHARPQPRLIAAVARFGRMEYEATPTTSSVVTMTIITTEMPSPNSKTVHGPANDQRKMLHVGEHAPASNVMTMATNAGSQDRVIHPGNFGRALASAEFVLFAGIAAAAREASARRAGTPKSSARPNAHTVMARGPFRYWSLLLK